MTAFFTADTHFGHANALKFGRDAAFSSVDEMDAEMIRRWNDVVSVKDDVYHLGDFTLRGLVDARRYWSLLRGRVHLVHGNHDQRTVRKADFWASSQPYLEIQVEGRHLVLCHYALRVWNRAHYGALMLYGHSHGNLPGNAQSTDVGVDAWDFRPVTLDGVLARLATLKPFRTEDHHVTRLD